MKETTIILLFLLLNQISFSQDLTDPRLDSLISKTILKNDIPSMVVAIVKTDSIYYGIQGRTRIDSTEKVLLEDKYHIGSNTKAFTSFLAFQAIEDNKISLETKFTSLFPDIEGIRDEYKEVNLSNLLSHNARVRPFTSGKEFKKLPKFNGNKSEKRLEFAKFVLKQKPVAKGEYSNAGYVLAALMIEKVYNLPFEIVLKSSMDSLGLDVLNGFPNKQKISYPWGHWKAQGKQVSLPPEHDYKLEDYMLSAGDLSINILDYSKFIQKHLNGALGGDSTLHQDSYEKLLYGIDSYSYGWQNQINDKGKLAFHDGSAGTFYCHTLISTTYEFAIIMIMNCADEDQVEGLYDLRTELFKIRKELR